MFALGINAQTFDIEQTAQLIRPRMKLESKYTFDPITKDTSGSFTSFDNSASFTFPIKRKFGTEINIDVTDFKLRDIFKKNIRIKASEILGTFKMGQKQTQFGVENNILKRDLYYVNAGIIGLHLTKKYRILFYSANLNLHEEGEVFNKLVPRFSGVIGQYHIRGLRKSYYYGFSLIYSDGLLVPSPFFGGTIPLNNQFTFNYTLPVQLNIQYHQDKTFLIAGVKSDGFRAGIASALNGRVNMNYGNGAAFLNFRYRFSRIFQLQAEGGYNFYQFMSFDDGLKNSPVWPTRTKLPLNTSFYGSVSLNIYFGKSLLEKVVDQLF